MPVGGRSPSSSRVRFPATRSRRRRRQGIRSSRALPRLGSALLRRRRRVRGGGVRLCRLLYRSLCQLLVRRCGEAAMLVARFVKKAAAAAGVAARWRVDQVRLSLGVCRRRALIQDWRSSGCIPGRWFFTDDFNPPMVTGDYCSSIQSFLATGVLQIWVISGALGASDGWRWSSPMWFECTAARDFLVIFVFSRASVHFCLVSCLCILYSRICILSLYVFLTQ